MTSKFIDFSIFISFKLCLQLYSFSSYDDYHRKSHRLEALIHFNNLLMHHSLIILKETLISFLPITFYQIYSFFCWDLTFIINYHSISCSPINFMTNLTNLNLVHLFYYHLPLFINSFFSIQINSFSFSVSFTSSASFLISFPIFSAFYLFLMIFLFINCVIMDSNYLIIRHYQNPIPSFFSL